MSTIKKEHTSSSRREYAAPGFMAVKAFNRSSLPCNCGPVSNPIQITRPAIWCAKQLSGILPLIEGFGDAGCEPRANAPYWVWFARTRAQQMTIEYQVADGCVTLNCTGYEELIRQEDGPFCDFDSSLTRSSVHDST